MIDDFVLCLDIISMSFSIIRSIRRPSKDARRAALLEQFRQISRTAQALGELAPFPYIKGLAAVVVIVVEAIQLVDQNKHDFGDLAQNILAVVVAVRDVVRDHGGSSASLQQICLDFTSALSDLAAKISKVLREMQKQNIIKRIIMAEDIRGTLQEYTGRFNEIRQQLSLRMVIEANFRMAAMQADVSSMGQAIISSQNQITTDLAQSSTTSSDTAILAPTDEEPDFCSDYTLLKLGDIVLGLEAAYPDVEHEFEADGQKRVIGRIDEYSGRLVTTGGMPVLVRRYEGSKSLQWKHDLEIFSSIKHPNILQLYGLSHSKRFQTLVFHGVTRSAYDEYHYKLSGIDFIKYPFQITEQFMSANGALEQHGFIVSSSEPKVDASGMLIIDQFSPSVGIQPSPEPWPVASFESYRHVLSDFETSKFKRFRLLEYYDVLSVQSPHWSIGHGVGSPAGYLGISLVHPDVHIPLFPFPTDALVLQFMNLKDTQTVVGGINLQILADLSVRCAIPITEMRNFSFLAKMKMGLKDSSPDAQKRRTLFRLWASQFHHLIRGYPIDMAEVQTCVPSSLSISCRDKNFDYNQYGLDSGPADWRDPDQYPLHAYDVLYMFCRRPPATSVYSPIEWSSDSECQHKIDSEDIQTAFGIQPIVVMHCFHFDVPPQIYPILREIHVKCGFDPESTQIAEHLGYQVLEAVEHGAQYEEASGDDFSTETILEMLRMTLSVNPTTGKITKDPGCNIM
ncbi:hypothetical protein C8J56DRAFT_941045 [Mycena floridula]|nr:hypothetical protein C8J56DRAFT_941045 [Mycena floridula]